MRTGILLVSGCLLLAGCGNLRDSLGLGKNTPDEFAVVTRAPLSMPPTYDLRPPMPGARRPQEQGASDAARQALLGQIPAQGQSQAGEYSGVLRSVKVNGVAGQGEQALLAQAGAAQADDAVRAQIDRETAQMASVNASLLAQIQQTTVTPDPVLDAAQESQRVRDLTQQKAPVSGAGAVTRAAKKPTLWDRLIGWF